MPKRVYRLGPRSPRALNKKISLAAAVLLLIIAGAIIAFSHGRDGVFTALGLKKPPVAAIPEEDDGNLYVHFIDVGQGDCELIVSGGKAVLIDCGEKKYAEYVISYIKSLKITKLDCIIATHPHSDHIGGMEAIIDEFKPDVLYMPQVREDVTPTTSAFVRMLDAIERNEAERLYARDGAVIDYGFWRLEFIAPVFNTYDNLNDYSVVVKAVCGENSFLFTGDIESSAEKDILDSGADISADVLKVAHHGSLTSSSARFLKAVGGDFAVIEVGAGNGYGHPNDGTVKRLEENGYEICRTDVFGDIVFVSDSYGINIYTRE